MFVITMVDGWSEWANAPPPLPNTKKKEACEDMNAIICEIKKI